MNDILISQYIVFDSSTLSEDDDERHSDRVIVFMYNKDIKAYNRVIWYDLASKIRRVDSEDTNGSFWRTEVLLTRRTENGWKFYSSKEEFVNDYAWILFV